MDKTREPSSTHRLWLSSLLFLVALARGASGEPGSNPPIIHVSPESLDFGIAHACDPFWDSYCGDWCETRPLTQSLVITNTAAPPSTLDFYLEPRDDWWAFYEAFGTTVPCSQGAGCSIAAGGSMTITLTFRPLYAYSMDQWLRLVSQDPGQAPIEIPIYGRGGYGSYEFVGTGFLGEVALGGTLLATQTIRSVGTSCLSFGDPNYFTDPDCVLLDSSATGPYTLQPGESHTWSLACTPTRLGTHGTTMSIPMWNVGVDDLYHDMYWRATGSAFTVTPASIAFTGAGEVPVGTSVTRRVTVRHISTFEYEYRSLTAIASSDPQLTAALVDGDLPLTLGPGEEVQVDVTFTPTDHVRTTGTITFDADEGDDPALAVVGDGVRLELAASPAASIAPFRCPYIVPPWGLAEARAGPAARATAMDQSAVGGGPASPPVADLTFSCRNAPVDGPFGSLDLSDDPEQTWGRPHAHRAASALAVPFQSANTSARVAADRMRMAQRSICSMASVATRCST
jgi:hypothetical protein